MLIDRLLYTVIWQANFIKSSRSIAKPFYLQISAVHLQIAIYKIACDLIWFDNLSKAITVLYTVNCTVYEVYEVYTVYSGRALLTHALQAVLAKRKVATQS